MKILYFAWLKTKLGIAEEALDLPAGVSTVAGLLAHLQARGPRFAEALKDLSVIRVAVNQDYVGPDHGLAQGDEVAIFPRSPEAEPVIRVQVEDFDPGAELAALGAGNRRIGAVTSFVGLVRDIHGDDRVQAMTLEHYPGMTEKMLAAIEDEARRRWPLEASLIIHRHGRLEPGDRIVMVATASPHRDAAFDACRFLIDWLKTKAPFWKLEETDAGERWVEARASDDAAAERWAAAPMSAGTSHRR